MSAGVRSCSRAFLAAALAVLLMIGANAATVATEAIEVVTGRSGSVHKPNFVVDGRPGAEPASESLRWRWTAPSTGEYTFDTHGSEFGTVLTVFAGEPGAGEVVAENDDDGDLTTSRVRFTAEQDVSYTVQVRVEGGAAGMAALSWRDEPPAGERSAVAQQATFPAIPVSVNTGEKPQSKVWQHDGRWWAVLSTAAVNPRGAWLWRLDPGGWTNVLHLSPETAARADTLRVGEITHVLLHGPSSSLVSLEYSSRSASYSLWSERPSATPVSLPGSETATIDVDSTGRLWLASDAGSAVQVRYSDPPYSSFARPVTLAGNITEDDIAMVVAMPGRIGVLWSNQNTQRFGFRTHVDGTPPSQWTGDEVPAAHSAIPVGNGMADDHLNAVVADDGTLYAAIKTSYNSTDHPVIGLLVRHPDGTWDGLHEVARHGTRPIVLLDEGTDTVHTVYTESEGLGDIEYQSTSRQDIGFPGDGETALDGDRNNVTGMKEAWSGEQVVLAAGSTHASHAVIGPSSAALTAHWALDEGSGQRAGDSSGLASHGVVFGVPVWTDGVAGSSLDLDGIDDWVVVPDGPAVDGAGQLTIAAWVRPERVDTQYVVKKAELGTTDGYEVGLASSGTVFVRVNQASSGNTFRVDSTAAYPADGQRWVHVAATYDGSSLRLYLDGVGQGAVEGPAAVGANELDLFLGAGEDGYRPMAGGLDDVRLYSRALTADQIGALVTGTQP